MYKKEQKSSNKMGKLSTPIKEKLESSLAFSDYKYCWTPQQKKL